MLRNYGLCATAYDSVGCVESVTYGSGGRVRYGYDSWKRLERVSYDTADTATAPRFVYSYGAHGEVKGQ